MGGHTGDSNDRAYFHDFTNPFNAQVLFEIFEKCFGGNVSVNCDNSLQMIMRYIHLYILTVY